MNKKPDRIDRLSREFLAPQPEVSAKTLEVQACYQPECQYCELLQTGGGPLAHWFVKIDETDTSVAWLHRDQLWPGRCVLAVKQHVTEIFHLDAESRRTHLAEMAALAEAVQQAFNPDKINYECLGNLVEHVHWHIIPRYKDDFLWRRTVWEEPHEPLLLDDAENKRRAEIIRGYLGWGDKCEH